MIKLLLVLLMLLMLVGCEESPNRVRLRNFKKIFVEETCFPPKQGYRYICEVKVGGERTCYLQRYRSSVQANCQVYDEFRALYREFVMNEEVKNE